MSALGAIEATLAAANLTLRRARPADAEGVKVVVRAAYAKWIPLIGREPTPMQADYDRAVSAHRIDVVAGADGLVALTETMRRTDHLWIENIAVRPDLHGKGIGRLLLRHAEVIAEAEGLGALRLLTNGAFEANITLYQRCGYVIDRTEPFMGGVTVYMSKALTRPTTAGRLIFLPGVGADPDFWRPLGDRLPADWRKVYLGWPGLGHQPARADVNGYDDLVRLVEAELTDEPADLLAQSMGGAIALAVALRNPDRVRRLVLTVTAGGLNVAALGAAEWRAGYHAEYPNAARWVAEPWGDRAGDVPRVTAPTLLIFGDADPIAPVAVGQRLAELLPNATLKVLPGGDHALVAQRAAEIAPWIAEHLA